MQQPGSNQHSSGPNNPALLILAARTQATIGEPAKSEALPSARSRWIRRVFRPTACLASYTRSRGARRGEDQVSRGPPARSKSVGPARCWRCYGRERATKPKRSRNTSTRSIDPRAGVAANNLAYIYVSTDKQLDEALQLAQTAVQAMPDEPVVNDTLGWIYVRKNQAALGVHHLESSVQKTPDDPVFNYHLGMAYVQTGEFDKAKRALTKALSIRPDFEGAAAARKALATIGA